MDGRVVKGDRPVEVRTACRNLAADQRRTTHDSVRDQARSDGVLLFGEREKLLGEPACHVAIERQVKRPPDPEQGSKREKRIVGGLAERLRLLDQQPCLLGRRLAFRRGVPLDVTERGEERYLQPELFATQRGRRR
jgi:hypothetical protein